MNITEPQEDGLEKARMRLMKSFDYLISHSGSGHLEVNTKILKREQKEITVQCSRCYRFVADFTEKREEE